MKNIIILDKIFKINRKHNSHFNCQLWFCTYNGKLVATLRVFSTMQEQKGSWYLSYGHDNPPWIIIRDQNKSKTVKVMVLNYILTNFNNL